MFTVKLPQWMCHCTCALAALSCIVQVNQPSGHARRHQMGGCVTALVHRQHSLALYKSTSLLGMLADIRWFSSATSQQQQASVTLQVMKATMCLHTVCCKLGTVGAVTRPIQACLIGSNPQKMCLLRFWAQASLALLPDQAGLLRNLQVHL